MLPHAPQSTGRPPTMKNDPASNVRGACPMTPQGGTLQRNCRRAGGRGGVSICGKGQKSHEKEDLLELTVYTSFLCKLYFFLSLF